MKYRQLGRDGPMVSAISMGRGSQAIQFGDELMVRAFNATIRRASELGIGYVAYALLGRGLLTGRIKAVDDLSPHDRRRRHPRFEPENLATNVKLVEEPAPPMTGGTDPLARRLTMSSPGNTLEGGHGRGPGQTPLTAKAKGSGFVVFA